jgi:peptide/nickel transport system substrate-binding protein
MAILPRHLLEDVPPDELAQHPFGTQCPVGNGPFVFVSHRPQESWTFRANPVFPEALGGRPFVDRYVYRVIPEPATLLTELFSGTVDLYLQPTPDQAEAIIENPDTGLNSFFFRDFVFVGWNARKPQLADARVRRAITMGTDRQTIVQALLRGYGEVAYSSVPPFHFAHDPSLASDLAYDPRAAAALLDEAGWIDRDGDGVRERADGLPLSISVLYNTGNQLRQGIAELMQAQLRGIGIDVRPEVADFSNIIARIMDPETRDFDGVVMGWVPEFKVDDSDLFHSERIDQLYAWAGTRNPEIDRLLDTLQLVVERDEARPLWRDYQTLLAEEQPYTFFYYPQRLEGVRTRLRNVVADSRGEWINVGKWWLDPADRRGN